MNFFEKLKRWWNPFDIPTVTINVEIWVFDPKPDVSAYELYLCQKAYVPTIGVHSVEDWKNENHARYNQLPEHCRRHMKLINKTCIVEAII